MSIGLVVALLAMTLFAVGVLLLPLLSRRPQANARTAYNLAVYRDQLAEVERDAGRGLLTREQAEAARAEIGRRILALGPLEGDRDSGGSHYAAMIVAVLVLPLVAWLLYSRLGAPELPDQPFADRGNPAPANLAAGKPHPEMGEAVARLAAHLKDHPEDLTGWLLLGRAELSLTHYREAADALRHAADLAGNRADILGDLGEALVMAANGAVTPAAREAFAAALHDPDTAPRSRYYLALAQLQQGDAKGALQGWVDLEAESPADAAWLPLLRERIAEVAATLGIDPATLKTSAGEPRRAPAAAAAKAGGPAPADVSAAAKAAADASPQQRRAMIMAMVKRLAARLEQQPDDAEGWARLGRSYMVLNEPAKARDAYARAVKLRPDDLAIKQGYAEAMIAAAGDAPPPEAAVALLRQVLQAEPDNPVGLWYVGEAEAVAGHSGKARELWSRLLRGLPATAPERREVEARLAALKPAGRDRPRPGEPE